VAHSAAAHPSVGDLPLPIRPLHTDLALLQVDILPVERHHLATPEPGFAAEQDDQPPLGRSTPPSVIVMRHSTVFV
jgi:hypothetical protein